MPQNTLEGSTPATFCEKLRLLYFLMMHRLLHQCRLTQPTVVVALLLECMQLAQFSVSNGQ